MNPATDEYGEVGQGGEEKRRFWGCSESGNARLLSSSPPLLLPSLSLFAVCLCLVT